MRYLKHCLSLVLPLTFGASHVSAEEFSPGGSAIKRYGNVVPKENLPESEAAHVAEIEDALKPFLGENYVFHEIVSSLIHLDVLVFKPTATRNFWTFVTSGMSDMPMTVPAALPVDEFGYAELVITLPANWFTTDEEGMIPRAEMDDTQKFWPVGLLKFLARFPHEYETWVWEGHTIPNGNPAEPYASDTDLSGALLTQLYNWPEKYRQIKLKDGTLVNLFAIVPIYDDEMTAKLEFGFDPVFSALAEAGVAEIVDVARPSIAPRLAN